MVCGFVLGGTACGDRGGRGGLDKVSVDGAECSEHAEAAGDLNHGGERGGMGRMMV